MSPQMMNKISISIVVTGLIMTGLAFLSSASLAMGVFAGATLSTVNWLALKWVATQMSDQHIQKAWRVVVILMLKMGLVLTTAWILVTRLSLHPVGIGIGVAALFFGAAIAALLFGESRTEEVPSDYLSSYPTEDL